MNNTEKVIVIGGAESQCHLIELLQRIDKYVIAVDFDENCKGRILADSFYKISTNDVQAIVELGKKENISAVFAVQSDLGMITASRVASKLGLNGLSENMAELFTNKYKMRCFLRDNGFMCPDFQLCLNDEEISQYASRKGFPFVIKPLDSQGSRGVRIVKSTENINYYKESEKYNRDNEGVIVEEFIGSDEYTVEGIVVGGKHYTLGVSHKKHYEQLECVSNELFYSWEAEYDELIKKHNEMINQTGLPFGITHSEYIKNKEKGFTLVEFAARGGGSMISSHIVPAISGWDIEEIYIKEVLNEKIELTVQKRNCAVLKFVQLEERKIKKICGLDKIKSMEKVLHVQLSYKEGEVVQPVLNDTNRHGYYIAWAETREELEKIMKNIEDLLIVEYE